MTILKISKTDPLYEDLALHYHNSGLNPENVIEHLKRHGYVVKCSRGRVMVDAITVANIVRGIALAQRIIPQPKVVADKPKPATKTTTTKKPKVPVVVEIDEDEIPF